MINDLVWQKGYDDRVQENNIKFHQQELGDNISSEIVKTIGVAGDFKTFAEAQAWHDSLVDRRGAHIILEMIDAEHYEVLSDGDTLFKIIGNSTVTIRNTVEGVMCNIFVTGTGAYQGFTVLYGACLNLTDIYITQDREADIGFFHTVVKYGSYMNSKNVGFENGSNGCKASTDSKMYFFNASFLNHSASSVYAAFDCYIFIGGTVSLVDNEDDGMLGIFAVANTQIFTYAATIEVTNIVQATIMCAIDSKAQFYATEFNLVACDNVFYVDLWGAAGCIELKANTVLNADEATLPGLFTQEVNVITSTGAYISDNTGPLVRIGETAPDLMASKDYLLSAEFGNALPTADPLVTGTLWNNAGVLSISA